MPMNENDPLMRLAAKIEKNRTPIPFIIYVGDAPESLHALSDAVRKFLSARYENVEEIFFSGISDEPNGWHGEMMTIPMFPAGKLILIRHAEAMLKKIESNKEILKRFAEDLSRISEFSTTILQFDQKKIPAKLKELENIALEFEEPVITPQLLLSKLKSRAKDVAYRLEDECIEILCERSAFQPKLAFQYFEQLLTLCMHEKYIRIQDVEDALGQQDSNHHFKLIDLISERNIAQAMHLLNQHEYDDGVMVLAGWIKLFIEALRFREYSQSGISLEEMHRRMGYFSAHAYSIKKNAARWQQLLRNYSAAELSQLLEILLRTDHLLKEQTDANAQKIILTGLMIALSSK